MNYIEITLLPTLEVSQPFLLSKLYSAIHKRLVELKDENENVTIGISFPEYSSNTLGSKLRLFAESKEILENFDAKKTLRIYTEYAHISSIRETPNGITSYAKFTRVQSSPTPERIARRKAKRTGCTYEEAIQSISEYAPDKITLPYILIKSSSTNKGFSLFIRKEQVVTTEPFIFNTYGLSKGGSIPDF